MTYKKITPEEIIFIHKIIAKNFGLPKGSIKTGDLELLIEKSEYIPFSNERHMLFQQASIIFEGLVRLHIFTDGNKRTALETTRQFLNRNNHVLVIPLSGTNFIYTIASNESRNSQKVIDEINAWLRFHSPKTNEWHKIYTLIIIYLRLPLMLMNFFAKIKLNKISKHILYRYLSNRDPKITDFMYSIYEKQFHLFLSSKEEYAKKHN